MAQAEQCSLACSGGKCGKLQQVKGYNMAGERIASLCANHGKKYVRLERKQVGAGAACLEESLGAAGQAPARAAAATAASGDGGSGGSDDDADYRQWNATTVPLHATSAAARHVERLDMKKLQRFEAETKTLKVPVQGMGKDEHNAIRRGERKRKREREVGWDNLGGEAIAPASEVEETPHLAHTAAAATSAAVTASDGACVISTNATDTDADRALALAGRTLNDEGEGIEMVDVEMGDASDDAPRPRQQRRLPRDSDDEPDPTATPTGTDAGAAAGPSGAARGRASPGAAARQDAASAVLTAVQAASTAGGQAGTSQPSGSQLPAAHAADGRHDAMLHRVANGEGGIMRQIVQHEQDRVMAAAVADTAVSRPSGPPWGDVLAQHGLPAGAASSSRSAAGPSGAGNPPPPSHARPAPPPNSIYHAPQVPSFAEGGGGKGGRGGGGRGGLGGAGTGRGRGGGRQQASVAVLLRQVPGHRPRLHGFNIQPTQGENGRLRGGVADSIVRGMVCGAWAAETGIPVLADAGATFSHRSAQVRPT